MRSEIGLMNVWIGKHWGISVFELEWYQEHACYSEWTLLRCHFEAGKLLEFTIFNKQIVGN